MTVCNMSIEGGARAGMIAPDEKTYAYLKGRPKAPKGAAWDMAMRYWETLQTDEGAHFDREIRLDAAKLPPIVTWGTSPEDVISITGVVPDPAEIAGREQARSPSERALDYMGLKPGTKITDIQLDVRLDRLLHQRPHRGPARGRQGRRAARTRRTASSTR